jgi:predicted regulator of Ras-like GTPase activity (Roadblock/LC7/MglB family)
MDMTFRDIIEAIHLKDQGVTSGALVGSDGLTVEEWHAPGDGQDLSALCAEMAQFFRESDRIARENGLGESAELSMAGDSGRVFLHRVSADYLLAVVTTPAVIPGKCRFLLRQAARRSREIL